MASRPSTVSDADRLNVSISSRCLLGIMKMCRSIKLALCAAWPGLVRLKPSVFWHCRAVQACVCWHCLHVSVDMRGLGCWRFAAGAFDLWGLCKGRAGRLWAGKQGSRLSQQGRCWAPWFFACRLRRPGAEAVKDFSYIRLARLVYPWRNQITV